MERTGLASKVVVACALLTCALGCEGQAPLTSIASPTCQPGGQDAGVDVATPATDSAQLQPAAPMDAAPDLAVLTSYDARPAIDLAAADAAGFTDGPLPPGVTETREFPPKPYVDVTVDLGVRADLQQALGRYIFGFIGFADKVFVTAGYGVDYVYLKAGSLTPVLPGEANPGQGASFNVTFGGFRAYPGEPKQPPHPEFAPARVLFDAMTRVPETITAEYRVRESPGGRVLCREHIVYDAVYCRITGVQRASIW
jgi:hypothetical protein